MVVFVLGPDEVIYDDVPRENSGSTTGMLNGFLFHHLTFFFFFFTSWFSLLFSVIEREHIAVFP